jgi:hypothetical protein
MMSTAFPPVILPFSCQMQPQRSQRLDPGVLRLFTEVLLCIILEVLRPYRVRVRITALYIFPSRFVRLASRWDSYLKVIGPGAYVTFSRLSDPIAATTRDFRRGSTCPYVSSEDLFLIASQIRSLQDKSGRYER